MFEGITATTLPSAEIDAVIAYAKGTRSSTSPHTRTLLFVSAAAFVLTGGTDRPFTHVLVLLAVIVLHELGHVLAMRFFRYEDVRLVSVPSEGGVASARAMNAPAWQRAVVLLAGPLPGLAISGLLLMSSASGWVRLFAAQLAFVNALNLLPFYPLDGGGFVQQLFAARPRVQVWVGSAGLVALALFSLAMRAWVLLAISVLFLLGSGLRFRRARESAELRVHGPLPPMSELSDESSRDLYHRAVRATDAPSPHPMVIADYMRQIHDMASLCELGARNTVLLVSIYSMGCVIGVEDFILLFT